MQQPMRIHQIKSGSTRTLEEIEASPVVERDVPETRDGTPRHFDLDEIEIREEGEKLKFVGHGAVVNRLSDDLGGFRERIMPGAFRKSLDNQDDVRFLFNHDPNYVLARTKSKTLELSEDPRGLRAYAEFAPTTFAKDLAISIRRGDIDQMSFGFIVGKGNDVWVEEDEELIRVIKSFDKLFDVSAVTFPAYPQTDASMRSLKVAGIELIRSGEIAEEAFRSITWQIHRGEVEATSEERRALDEAAETLDTVTPWVAQRAVVALDQGDDLRGAIPGSVVTVQIDDEPEEERAEGVSLDLRRRRLALLAQRAGLTTTNQEKNNE